MFFEWPHPSSVLEQKKCQGSNADMINLALEYDTYRFKFSLNRGPNLSLEVFSVNSPPPPPPHTHTHTQTHPYTRFRRKDPKLEFLKVSN